MTHFCELCDERDGREVLVRFRDGGAARMVLCPECLSDTREMIGSGDAPNPDVVAVEDILGERQ